MEQPNLFNFKNPQLRLGNGRYCTEEQYRQETVYNENKRLRYEREKYLRAWLAAASRVAALERELYDFRKDAT